MKRNKKKTIAFVIGSLKAGGAERVVSTLANKLVEKYDVVIITIIKRTPFYPLDERVKVVHCKSNYRTGENILGAIANNANIIYKLSSYLLKFKVDLAVGFMTSANSLTAIASWLSGVPCIISERTNPYAVKLGKTWETVRRVLYPSVKYLVVQSNHSRSYFQKIISQQKVVVLPNPLTPDLEHEGKNNHVKENIILNVGRLIPVKSQDVLINAFSNIPNKGWKLILVGEGGYRAHYEKLVDELNLKEQIIFAGDVKNVNDYYRKSKIFAFTSQYEGFPNVLIEAMYLGLACVSTNCPSGPAELIVNGENGILIPVGDQLQLERSLIRLMNDLDFCEKLSTNAMKRAKAFEVDNVFFEWDKLITAAISRKNNDGI